MNFVEPEKYCIGKKKCELDTPCLIIDLDLLDANLRKMQSWGNLKRKQIRPHAKTHKCSTLAARQIEMGAQGICVAKVSEAEVLLERGIHNILITGPVATSQKVRRLAECVKKDPATLVVIDSLAGARLLQEEAANQGIRFSVLIDFDIGQGRTGIHPSQGLAFAREISRLPLLELKGIQAYAGQVQHLASFAERRRDSLAGLGLVAKVFLQLREAESTCTIFSGGGTGTYAVDVEVPELTELQVGSYALMDAEYGGIQALENHPENRNFPASLTLLSTVVSTNHQDFVTIDAGLKALYRDGAVPLVVGHQAGKLVYDWFGDEYGRISLSGGEKSAGSALPAQGEKVELVVSHCDPTVNLFDYFYITQNDLVVDQWPIDLRGKSQ